MIRMSEINLMKQKEGEEKKVVFDKLNAAQLSMDFNNVLKDQTYKTDMLLSIIKGEIFKFYRFLFPFNM